MFWLVANVHVMGIAADGVGIPEALVLFDAYCTCADIDSRAAGIDTPYATQQLLDLGRVIGVFFRRLESTSRKTR